MEINVSRICATYDEKLAPFFFERLPVGKNVIITRRCYMFKGYSLLNSLYIHKFEWFII